MIQIGDLLITLQAQFDGAQQFIAALRDTKTATQDASTVLDDLRAKLLAVNTSSQNSAGGISEIGDAINGLSNIVGRMAIRQAFVQIEQIIVEVSQAFDAAQEKIVGATGKIGDSLGQLNDTLSTVLDTATQKTDQVGLAIGRMAAAFKLDPSADLANITTQVLDLAKVTGQSVDSISTDTAKLAKAWDLADPSDVVDAMNRLLTVSQNSDVKITDLATTVTKFSGVFKELDVDLDSATQFVGLLADKGLNANSVLTSMQGAMKTLAKDGAGNLSDALTLVFQKMRDAPNAAAEFAIASKLFTGNAAEMVDAVNKLPDLMDRLTESLDPLHAKIQDQATAVETLAEKWQNFKNQLAATGAFDSVNTELKATVDELGWMVGALQSVMGALSDTGSTAAAVFGGIASEAINAANTILSQVPGFSALKNLAASGSAGPAAGGSAIGGFAVSDQRLQQLNTIMTNALSAAEKLPSAYSVPGFLTGTQIAPGSAASTDPTSASAFAKAMQGNAKGPADPEYKALADAVRQLQRRVDAKNDIDFLKFEQQLYTEMLTNPTPGEAAYMEAANLAKQVAKYQAVGKPVSDQKYADLSSLQYQKTIAGLDQGTAQKLLGLPNPADVIANMDEIGKAFDLIASKADAAPNFIAIAWDKLTAKTLADARSIGRATDDMVLAADAAAALDKISNMDLGTASQTLGLTTLTKAMEDLAVQQAAYDEILKAYNNNQATWLDVENAEIDALTKKKTALANLGLAFQDADQVQLDYLNTQKQIASLNTEGALKMLGVGSQQDLDNAIDLIQTAYAKVQTAAAVAASENATLEQARQVIFEQTGVDIGKQAVTAATAFSDVIAKSNDLNSVLAKTRALGGQVFDPMVQDAAAASAAAALATNDLGKAIQSLNVTTEASADATVQQVQDSLDRIGNAYGTSSEEYVQAVISADTQITAVLQRTGQAVPAAITQQLDALTTAYKNASITIDQAYSDLGIKSASAVANSLATTQAALAKLTQDSTVNTQQMFDANVLATQSYFAGLLATHQDFSQKDKALNDLQVAQVKLALSDQENAWTHLSNAVKDVWTSIDNDMASGIVGVINGTESVSAAFLKMGQDVEAIIVKYILNQLLFTQSNLNSLQQNILGLFGAKATTLTPQLGSQAAGANPLNLSSLNLPKGTVSAPTVGAAPGSDLEGQSLLDQLNAGAANIKDAGVDAGQSMSLGGSGAQANMIEGGSTFNAGMAPDVGVIGDGMGEASNVFSDGVGEAANTFGSVIDDAGQSLSDVFKGGMSLVSSGADSLASGADSIGGSLASGASAISGAGSTFSAGASGIMSSLSSMTGLFTGISAVVGIASGIVSGIQQAHANSLLDLIEKNTRAIDITVGGTGDADGISEWMKTTGQKATAMLDFMNGDLRQYLQNINVDLDYLAGGAGGTTTVKTQIDWSPLMAGLQAIYNELLVIISQGNAELQIMQQNGSVVQSSVEGAAAGAGVGAVAKVTPVSSLSSRGNTKGVISSVDYGAGLTGFPQTNAYADTGNGLNATPQYSNSLTADSAGVVGGANNPATYVANPAIASLTQAASDIQTAAASAAQAAYASAYAAWNPVATEQKLMGAVDAANAALSAANTPTAITAATAQLTAANAALQNFMSTQPQNTANPHAPTGIDPITGVLFSKESATQAIQDSINGAGGTLINPNNTAPAAVSPTSPLAAALGQTALINPLTNVNNANGVSLIDSLLQSLQGPGGESGITAGGLNQDFGLNLTPAQFESALVPAIEAQFNAVLPDAATVQSMTGDQLKSLLQSSITPEFWTAFIASLGAGVASAAAKASSTAGIIPQITGSGGGLSAALQSLAASTLTGTMASISSTGSGIAAGGTVGQIGPAPWQTYQGPTDVGSGIAGSTYTGGIGSGATVSYAPQFPAAATLPATINWGAAGMPGGNAKATSLTINIPGANFPVGMSPQQVAKALVDELQTQTALIR